MYDEAPKRAAPHRLFLLFARLRLSFRPQRRGRRKRTEVVIGGRFDLKQTEAEIHSN
jgi:hypothetical protein